jgi:uncharacterized phage-associated protein
MNIHDVCNYIILKTKNAGEGLSLLKLQKLLYYSQAWHLAFYNERLFLGKFQAWVHGPVSREIYDRFSNTKSLYSEVTVNDVPDDFDLNRVPEDKQNHIDDILEVYAKYRGSQLEELTHREEPWVEARKGYRSSERCEKEISENTMRRYYAERIA